ncbi:MAG: Npt1/Npt2 family nucleotide transporter [Gammaproteobacteria bacterium]|nr:Npt1/Npt2 family nucleotide transporter [Gammaproteobacteria bacterium]
MRVSKEYQIAFMMAAAAFFTLVGYEFIRSPATVLFKNTWGAENLPLVMSAMPVVVFGGVALYGWILSHLGPRRTLLVTSLGSSCFIVACYFGLLTGSKMVTPILFLIKELYIVLLIEQYWSYINSSLTPTTAKKVNGPITGIAGLGGVVGGSVGSLIVGPLGTEAMVLAAALMLIPAAIVSNLTYRLHGEPEAPDTSDESISHHMGWQMFRSNPTLVCLLAIVLSSQVIAAVLDFKFNELLSVEFAGATDMETAFQLRFWGFLNLASIGLQFVIAPLLLSFIALRLVHLMLPLIHFSAIIFAIIEPSVFSVGLAFFLFKAFDYSIFRAAKEILYIPLEFDARYRAKEVIDVFGYRTGKGGSSVLIALAQRAGVIMGNYYLYIAFFMAAIWLTLVFPLTRQKSG